MSNKVVIGFFPKQICYIASCKREVAVGCEWDIDYGSNAKNKTEEVLPAFPADNNDKKSLTTATNWAKSDIKQLHYQNKLLDLPELEVVDNDFVTGIKLLKLEHRGNGGRAYKAIVNNYYVDVREDVVMDTMLSEGIAVGGILQGQFIWAKCGAQMKLVRKDSELYKLIAEFESKKDKKPVGKKKLEVGGVYRSKKKQSYIYLGNVNTTQFSMPDKNVKPPPYWDHAGFDDYNNNKKCFDFIKTEIKNKMLFFHLYKHESIQDSLKELLNANNYYRFGLKQSHTLIEKVDQLDLDKDIVRKSANTCAKEIKESILEYTGHKDPKKNYDKLTARRLANSICFASTYLNMYPSNEKNSETFDIHKYLLFS